MSSANYLPEDLQASIDKEVVRLGNLVLQYLADTKWDEARQHAHQLCGVAGLKDYTEIVAGSRRIEQALKKGELEHIKDYEQAFRSELKTFVKSLLLP